MDAETLFGTFPRARPRPARPGPAPGQVRTPANHAALKRPTQTPIRPPPAQARPSVPGRLPPQNFQTIKRPQPGQTGPSPSPGPPGPRPGPAPGRPPAASGRLPPQNFQTIKRPPPGQAPQAPQSPPARTGDGPRPVQNPGLYPQIQRVPEKKPGLMQRAKNYISPPKPPPTRMEQLAQMQDKLRTQEQAKRDRDARASPIYQTQQQKDDIAHANFQKNMAGYKSPVSHFQSDPNYYSKDPHVAVPWK